MAGIEKDEEKGASYNANVNNPAHHDSTGRPWSRRQSLKVVIIFVLWMITTSLGAIFSKMYLANGGDPDVLSLTSFLLAPAFWLFIKTIKLVLLVQPASRIDSMSLEHYLGVLLQIAPISVMHLATVYLTNLSLQGSDIKLTYTLKALEPIMTLFLNYIVTGRRLPFLTFLSILPIPVGIALTTLSDLSFSVPALIAGLFSVAVTSARAVFFKAQQNRIPISTEDLFPTVSAVSFVLFLPIALYHQIMLYYSDTLPFATTTAVGEIKETPPILYAALGGVFSAIYQFLSFSLLKLISPLHHAMGNVMKRVFTIASSVLVTGRLRGQPPSLTNWVGMGMANAGVVVFFYISQRRRHSSVSLVPGMKEAQHGTIQLASTGSNLKEKGIVQSRVMMLAVLVVIAQFRYLNNESSYNSSSTA